MDTVDFASPHAAMISDSFTLARPGKMTSANH
jgi:hypothetical protein